MCGICGQFSFSSDRRVVIEDVLPMANSLVHRGPDDEGFYVDRNIGFGFRRLSIIDLEGGHQPMTNNEGSVWVIFNGEIYNFKELRKTLQDRGYRFRTNSDTEVIVHGYSEWADDVLGKLNGMFGLAIWDATRRRLLLARDRMGIKVVYYAIEEGRLFFGSEIRAILVALPRKASVNPDAIESFLRYRYVPAPDTILNGIYKLPAGTFLTVEEGQEPTLKRWWQFAPRPFDLMPSDRRAEADLLDLYTQAVKRHLISDVPVGLLLSGGIDSALLLALISRTHGSLRTYSIGYGQDFDEDELSDAARTAAHFAAPNVGIEMSLTQFEQNLESVVSALEEPVTTSSILPMYFVCQRARQDVKVALVGQGPDELFGGYLRHLGVRYGTYWRALPKPIRERIKAMMAWGKHNEYLFRSAYSLEIEDPLARYQQVFSVLPEVTLRSLFQDGVLHDGWDQIPKVWRELRPLMKDVDDLGGLQFLEIRSSLPDELLLYADKLSMAHGLELRVPYLDKEIVEYVERLNGSFKVRYGIRKWLHRRVASQFLPESLLKRKKKGFATNVVDGWFRNSASPWMEEVFASKESLIFRYLRPSVVRDLLQEHKDGRADNHKILFSLIVLEHVLRKYDLPTFAPVQNVRCQIMGV
jgi:asparagine synthase (glutamine-hydrolysing)